MLALCPSVRRYVLFSTLLMTAPFLWPQSVAGSGLHDEQFSYIGLRLDELINRFGAPQTVHAARGENHWQDDVVFSYAIGDFYIYRDRVWQIHVRSILGINIGDAKAVAHLVLGESAQDMGDHILYALPIGAWPLSLRVNSNPAGRVSAIFVYRTDY